MQETVDTPQAAPAPAAEPNRRAGAAAFRPSLARRARRALAPLPWLAPALALIAFVVLWPVWEMFQTSRQHINSYGFNLGDYGWKNYSTLFADPNLGSVMVRTVLWVFAIVAITVLISLGLAQLLNRGFPGRKLVRWALIAPWAASVMMTAIVFRWMLDPNNGVVNVFLHQIGVVHDYNGSQASWLGDPTAALWWMIAVAVFVSVPFTTYALLAGLTSIPADVYEAARMDGAGKWRTYRAITFPLLRPALLVAVLINLMNVFNSFPIIWTMTGGGPDYQTSTSTVYMYALKQFNIGESGALSVVNFGVVILIVLVFLRANRSALKEG
ncbi:sugar ABC transporter permease [Actinospica sp. MGRD01-02]|uniref:Sugar ABC transporter permease n=1 Tax=Actinospica acidithermotolerans TaxID=2828514 RepID=A0A941E7U8_9ACTN|nr:sugar ABC transporter permease [Actinospica acidithermotolerans]MBR7825412.1 sugar ABC transporter permease [Actinospica acidithermotolerans]